MSSLSLCLASRAFFRSDRVARKFPFSESVRRPLCDPRGFAALSMDLLKELRVKSGAPVVDCKKALMETSNNLEKAMDWLREHGASKASSKVLGRATPEGLVALKVSEDGKSAAIVRVSSETDFAGRSNKFVEFAMDVAGATLKAEGIGRLPNSCLLETKSNDKTVKDLLDELIVAIRENISVADAIKLSTNEGIFVGYVHNKISSSNAGTSAAIVEVVALNNDMSVGDLQSAGKKLAMHVVAARPQYTTPADVPLEEVEKEKEILKKQLGDIKKSPEMIEKIIEGKLRKFYESTCLTEQAHMIEEKSPKVGKALKDLGIQVKSFTALSITKNT